MNDQEENKKDQTGENEREVKWNKKSKTNRKRDNN